MIDEKIRKLGNKFRGLWQVRELTSKAKRALRNNRCEGYKEFDTHWYVTFKIDNEFLETEPQATMEDALDYAINYLGIK
ncbi:MAG: hypothetical protein ACUZ8I_12305 [Candidatus Scalindua sp.]